MKMSKHLPQWQPKKLMTMYWAFLVAAFLLPVILLTINWVVTETRRQQNAVVTAQDRALNQVAGNLDNNMAHLITAAHQIALDPSFAKIPQNVTDYQAIQDALGRYNLSSSLIDQTWVNVFRTPGTLYTVKGTYSLDDAAAKYGLMPTNLSSRQKQAMMRDANPELFITPALAEGQQDQMTLMVPLMPMSGEQKGVVYFSLNPVDIHDILTSGTSSDSQVIGLTVNDRTLQLSSPTLAETPLKGLLGQKYQQTYRLADGHQLSVHRKASSTGLFEVVSYTLPPSLWVPLRGFFIHYLWLFGILLTGGLVLISFFAKRQYAVISGLEKILPTPGFNGDGAGDATEEKRLQLAIENYINNHQSLISASKAQLPFVRNQILQLILNGRVTDPEVVGRFLKTGAIALPYPHFVVALADQPAEWNSKGDEPLAGTNFTALFMHRVSEAQVVVLLNFASGEDPVALLDEIRDRTPFVHAKTALFISRTIDQLADLHEAYIEVVSMQVTARPAEGDNVRYTATADVTANAENPFDFNNELKLDNSLLQGHFEPAREAFEVLFNLASQSYDPQDRFDIGISNLISRVLKADYEKHAEVNETLVHSLRTISSLSQLHGILLTAIKDITSASTADSGASSAEEDVASQLKQYVTDHACSPTLSLVDVADHFGFSVPYTSRYIKEITGKTFTAFVTEHRLLSIQRALITTTAPIKSIIEQNGYYDVANFTRKFKKMTGVTPGEYRRMHNAADRVAQSS
ncbi:helix-turn-helix domain-containing protein [Lacticaseibacillus yichunensis]|uniref:Helix-turn-helix domain-containing protein n=1 Tax=Lacticaseibacillus yichunensis TaxID=2486015 RepID=A0ABW4CRI4_9LACO|nr:helix-turn-helix domain-containing protein [Lacticaseibacillus yichunensis]